MKARIIEVTRVNGEKVWTIQQKHFLFWWKWVNAWINSSSGAACQDTFYSLEEAQKHLCYFDGTKPTHKVCGN